MIRSVLPLSLLAPVLLFATAERTSAQPPLKQAVIDKVTAATALVKVDPQGAGDGSAFCIRKDGLFVSNWHVVAGVDLWKDVTLVLDSGTPRERAVKAKLLSTDMHRDLALLQVKGQQNLAALSTAKGFALTQPVYAFGFPFVAQVFANPPVSVNAGKIVALPKDAAGDLQSVVFDAVVNPGNSGGPLVDDKGDVVGVVAGRMSPPATNTSFAVPVDAVEDFLTEPGIVPHVPDVAWDARAKQATFRIDFVTDHGPTMPAKVELEVFTQNQGGRSQALALPAGTKSLAFQVAPYSNKPLNLAVRHGFGGAPLVHRGKKQADVTQLADTHVDVDTTIRLSDVARITGPVKEPTLVMRDGTKKTFPVKNLAPIAAILPQKDFHICVVHVDDNEQGYFNVRVRGLDAQGRVLFERVGQARFVDRPPFVQSAGDPPRLSAKKPLESIKVHVPMEGQARFSVGSVNVTLANGETQKFTGLWCSYPGLFLPPGDFSLIGPYVGVNDRVWHHSQVDTTGHPSNFLPIPLPAGPWTCRVQRTWAAAGNPPRNAGVTVTPRNGFVEVDIQTPQLKRAVYRLEFTPVRNGGPPNGAPQGNPAKS